MTNEEFKKLYPHIVGLIEDLIIVKEIANEIERECGIVKKEMKVKDKIKQMDELIMKDKNVEAFEFKFDIPVKNLVNVDADGIAINGEYVIGPGKDRTNLPFNEFLVNYGEGARPLTKRKEDAGFDVYPLFEDGQSSMVIKPHQTVIFKTGIRTAFPSSHYIHLEERGSTGVIGLSQRAGVIDSGYRGEWMIPVTNTNDIPVIISKLPKETIDGIISNYIYYPYSKAICQAVLHRCEHTEFRSVSAEDIDSVASERGTGKLGSSGK